MSTDDVLPTLDQSGVGPRPRSVTLAFWLWWPQIIAQALIVVSAMVASVAAIAIGGPALDVVIFYAVPVGIPVAAVTALEVWLLFRLRGGSRGARAMLAVLAIGATAIVIGSGVFQILMRLPSSGTVISMQEGPEATYGGLALNTLLAAATLAATILTFTPSARVFFAQRRGSDGAHPGSLPSAGSGSADGAAPHDAVVPPTPE